MSDGLFLQRLPTAESPGALIAPVERLTNMSAKAVAFSPDSQFAAVGTQNGLEIWSMSGQPKLFCQAKAIIIYSVTWDRHHQILTGEGSGNLAIWQFESARPKLEIMVQSKTHSDWIKTAAFNKGYTLVLSSSFDGHVALSNAHDLTGIWKVSTHSVCRAALWLSGEKLIVSCGDDRFVKVFAY
eukprot:TRINITY_DN1151_c0_g1_i1.p1 TRINITY_DN1151_c0_g1~~TRINITY_DN1151_c0_g1_i1.p1  ORF type:complete len:184 (-),score=35.17 TRINITY_DN1151_c0_g1_i1:250-801(-)